MPISPGASTADICFADMYIKAPKSSILPFTTHHPAQRTIVPATNHHARRRITPTVPPVNGPVSGLILSYLVQAGRTSLAGRPSKIHSSSTSQPSLRGIVEQKLPNYHSTPSHPILFQGSTFV